MTQTSHHHDERMEEVFVSEDEKRERDVKMKAREDSSEMMGERSGIKLPSFTFFFFFLPSFSSSSAAFLLYDVCCRCFFLSFGVQ